MSIGIRIILITASRADNRQLLSSAYFPLFISRIDMPIPFVLNDKISLPDVKCAVKKGSLQNESTYAIN